MPYFRQIGTGDGSKPTVIPNRNDSPRAVCDCLCHSLRMSSFKLPWQQIAQPSFQQRNDASHEEQPHSPSWCPYTAAGSFACKNGFTVQQILTYQQVRYWNDSRSNASDPCTFALVASTCIYPVNWPTWAKMYCRPSASWTIDRITEIEKIRYYLICVHIG